MVKHSSLRTHHFDVFCSMLAMIALAAFLPLSASAAGTAHPHVLGTRQNAHFQPGAGQGNLLYHGGPIMPNATQTYAIFWVPTGYIVSATYESLLERYFADVGGSALYHNNRQYKDSGGHRPTGSSLGGSWVDTQLYPSPELSDQQVQAEVTHAMQVNGWTASLDHMFFVFTAKGEVICLSPGTCSFSTFCAYHGFFNNNVIYAAMPYTDTAPPACDIPSGKGPNNDIAADSEINVTSHEQIEAATDPQLNAWYDATGYEIGDKCAWTFGNVHPDGSNVKWNGHPYIVQQEWDNAKGGCVLKGP